MSFYDKYSQYKDFNFDIFFTNITDNDIIRAINKESLNDMDFLALMSPKASKFLELMARKAQKLTIMNFGKVIFMYTPLYLANFCVNQCAYCGFNVKNHISRKILTMDELSFEAEKIASKGIRHILILTGESRKHTPVSYINEAVLHLKNYFKSISIEIYPLEASEYSQLIEAGVDGLTIYQEVYNEETYDRIHISGPKKNYRFRLDTPERACSVGMRSVNIGSLLGLDDVMKEAFFAGIHASYLQNKYLESEISISFPRIRSHVGEFEPKSCVSDSQLVQIILATRLYMPRAGITISTRENATLRDNLMGLGVTKMSAGSSTKVGGYSLEDNSDGQFDIMDERDVDEMRSAIYKKGYQPVFKDWQAI